MRKLITTGLIAVLAIVMGAATVQAQNPTSGTTGPLTWKYDTGTKTLTISGKGEMPNFNNGSPWNTLKEEIKDVVIEEGVTGISWGAFTGARALESVTLPKSLTKIGESAFSFCNSLSSMTIPEGVKEIGPMAFSFCEALVWFKVDAANTAYTSVDGVLFDKGKKKLICYPGSSNDTAYTIPTGTEEIAKYAFNHCYRLSAITLPEGVTQIKHSAFLACMGLTSMVIPKSVKEIEEQAFGNCWKLSAITVAEGNTEYTSVDGVLFDKAKTTLMQFPAGHKDSIYTIPNGTKKIGGHAFLGAKDLVAVTISADVKEIEEYAFEQVFKLKSLTVKWEKPLSINENAFDLNVPSNVTLKVPKGSKAAYAAAPVWKEFKQISESTVGNTLLPEARIYAAGGRLYLTLQTAAPVGIYTLNGVLVRTFSAPAGETTVALPQGVYIVQVGDTAEKVYVN